jgi:gliding motility-associated-like protein
MGPCEEQGKNVDVYAIRLSSQGEVLWKKHYGGPGIEDGYAVAATPDNHFIIAGMSRVNNADENFYVIKIDASGNLVWEKTLGGSASDMAFSVVVAPDGSCLVGGETFSNNGDVSGNHGQRDAWLVKLSSAGAVQWQKCFGGSMHEMCNKLAISYNGGFIAAMATSSNDGDVNGNKGGLDFWIVDLSTNGNINWSRCYGGMFNETPHDIQRTPDNGYVLTGSAESANGDLTCNKGIDDTWLMKLTATGTLQWQKSFGGSMYDIGFSVQPLADNSYLLAAQTCSQEIAGHYIQQPPNGFGTCGDYYIMKLSAQGAIQKPPSVTIDPKTATICPGKPATLFASALNAGANTTYQWQKNGQLMGENSPYLEAINLAPNDVIKCSIVSEGSCDIGSATASDVVIITSKPAIPTPAITIRSSSDMLCGCQEVRLEATVNNKGSLPYYTWVINGIPKWNNRAVLITNQLNPGDIVTCEYSDASLCIANGKVASNAIQFNGGSAAVASVSLASASPTNCLGSTTRIKAVTTNAGSHPKYQWTLNGQSIGIDADSLTIENPATGDRIRCIVTVDPQFTCSTTPTATSEELILSVKEKNNPQVSVESKSTTLCKGDEASILLHVQGVGNAPSYQWYVNDQLVNQQAATFKSTELENDDQVYAVVIPGGDVCDAAAQTTAPVKFTIYDVPQVKLLPTDTIVQRGAKVQLRAVINGAFSNYYWSPESQLEQPGSLQPVTISLRESADIIINVENEKGCSVQDVAHITVRSALYMSNAFTPNGDGRNDIFRIPEGTTLDLAEFSVFDRWGNRIFSTHNINEGWTGMIRGIVCNTGTYVYMIRGRDDRGPVLQKGTVLLIR